MSVLIKGMRMPENCIKCPMQFGGMCYVMPAEVDESRVAPTVEEALKQGKPDWCPLVEIPVPHGRLIDADAYCEDLLKEAHRVWGLLKPETIERINRTVDDLKNYPTIIEVEGRKDGENHDD